MKSNSEIIKKYNNTFISISIFFKVFKNLCLNENDEKMFVKNAYQLFTAHCLAAALYDVFTVEASIHPRQLKHSGYNRSLV